MRRDLSAIKNILILLKNRIEMVKNDQFKFLSRRVISWPDQMVKSDSARIKITKYNKCCIQNQDALGLGLGWWVIFYFRAFFGEADFALAFRFLAFSASNSFFWAEKLVWYDGTNLKQSQKMIFVQQLANHWYWSGQRFCRSQDRTVRSVTRPIRKISHRGA